MFYECTSLQEVILPKSLSTINKYAFKRCTSLNEIKIPSDAIIEYGAFHECPSLNIS